MPLYYLRSAVRHATLRGCIVVPFETVYRFFSVSVLFVFSGVLNCPLSADEKHIKYRLRMDTYFPDSHGAPCCDWDGLALLGETVE